MGIIRKTKSVQILLNAFEKNTHAISAIDLIQRLHVELNKTTIYRVLDKLEDDGILHSFLGINGLKWYAKCNGCTETKHIDIHPHFQCLECGKIDCLTVDVQIPNMPNREISATQVLIQGKCQECLQ